jgi:glutaredoxin
MTSEGFRPAPSAEEIIAARDDETESGTLQESNDNHHYPVLIISLDCAFCPPAKNLWSKIADELGIDLQVIIIERDKEAAKKYCISGVPCLVYGPDKKAYGLHYSHKDAKEILASTEQ